METMKFKTKILLKETLRDLPVGGDIQIFNYEFKPDVVRGAASELQREGLQFSVNGKGRVDNVIVTRIK